MENKKMRMEFLRFVLVYHLVLFIALFLVSLSVFSLLKKQQRHRMDAEAKLILERQENLWNRQMSVIRAFNAKCKYDKKYNELYTDVPRVYLDIKQELESQEQNVPFVQGIYVYDEERNIVVSSGGVLASEIFFGKLCDVDFSNLAGDKDFEIKGARAKLNSGDGIVLATTINTWSPGGQEKKYILYTMDKRSLEEQFGGNEDAGSVLFYKEEPLFASNSLKFDLVYKNDEYENIEKSGYKENLIKEYHSYEKELADGFYILYMAEKAGLKRSLNAHLKVYGIWLICSLTIGVALTLVFSKRRYKKYQRILDYSQELEGEKQLLLEENCLYKLISSYLKENDTLWSRCIENGIKLNRKWKFFIVLPQRLNETDLFYREIERKFVVDKASEMHFVDVVENVRVCLICSDEDAKKIDKKFIELINMDMPIGISEKIVEAKELRFAYKEAKRKYDRFYTKKRQYPDAELTALKTALLEEDTSKAIFLLEELKDYIEEASEINICGILWDTMRLFEKNSNEIPIDRFADRQDLINRVAKVLSEFEIELKDRKKQKNELKEEIPKYKKRNILDILYYIHDNYLDDNFSVKLLAENFQTSVSNISHFFKKNMEISISQYIEQLKLEKAEELLINSDKTIVEIAEELCYSNSTIFIEMFKKNKGITPGTYRENYKNDKKDISKY